MNKFISIISTSLFTLALFIGGIAFWVMPKQEISSDENRKLMVFPEATAQSIFSGKFEKAFEEYYNDHFPLRDTWINVASTINTLKGNQDQEIRVINVAENNASDDNYEEETHENETETNQQQSVSSSDIPSISETNTDIPLSETAPISDSTVSMTELSPNNTGTTNSQSVQDNSESSIEPTVSTKEENITQNNLPPKQEATTAQTHNAESATIAEPQKINDAEFSRIKGVVVVNGRVLQVFGGSKSTVQPFANMLNTYRSRLASDIKMYAMISPSGSDFYLPYGVNKGVLKEKENIALFANLLNPGIINVPAYDEIAPHKDEYIQFRTDHHWTGLGAYYAYVAFAKKAGFNPLPLSSMQLVKKPKSFLGSLYNYTKDQQLKNNPDFLEYYKVPTKSTVQVFSHQNMNNVSTGQVYAEYHNSYLLFIGGDYPLMHINTPTSEKRSILIVKDSFGNAFVPYLTMHYSDIYVVDYRYFKGNIPELMNKYGIKEMLYTHNSFAANSSAAAKYGLRMLNK